MRKRGFKHKDGCAKDDTDDEVEELEGEERKALS